MLPEFRNSTWSCATERVPTGPTFQKGRPPAGVSGPFAFDWKKLAPAWTKLAIAQRQVWDLPLHYCWLMRVAWGKRRSLGPPQVPCKTTV